MEEQKNVFSRLFDWVRGRFLRQQTDPYEHSPIVLDTNILSLATEIESYLSTYASPPFGYADIPGQRNAEEWIDTISESLIQENVYDADTYSKLISNSLTIPENMNNPNISDLANKLLDKLDNYRSQDMEWKM